MASKVLKSASQSKSRILKRVGEGDELILGADVHKKNYHLAARKNGDLPATWVMPHDDAALVKSLLPVKASVKRIVYEAGPTGYGLARTLQANGFDVRVVAPGKTPRAANESNKSDRLDCRKLAEYEEKGILGYVSIPTEEEDNSRALLRRYDGLKKEAAKAKVRIKSFLLYHDLREPEGLKSWSCSSILSLRTMELPLKLRLLLDSLLRSLDFTREEIARLQKHLNQITGQENSEEEKLLRTHPGVGPQTALHVLNELFCPKRFRDKRQVAAYVGLAPKVSRSGESSRKGGRLRGGRQALRNCLIEASWQWIRLDPGARMAYQRLLQNTGEANKAITAMARRMIINLWSMLCSGEKYRPMPVTHRKRV